MRQSISFAASIEMLYQKSPEVRRRREESRGLRTLRVQSSYCCTVRTQANTFVAAFYDAVLLYAEALNRTLYDGFNATDGDEIKKRMWNRTFASITGSAMIDAKGDRRADYSLLDYNPASGQFEARPVSTTRLESARTVEWT